VLPTMNTDRFEQLVGEAIEGLPEEFRELLDNVAIFIEDQPSKTMLRDLGMRPGETLLGLYEGVPHTERTSSYGLVPPDRITLFQRSIEESHDTDGAVAEQIRRTLLHEVGHHFGIDENRLAEIEAGWNSRST